MTYIIIFLFLIIAEFLYFKLADKFNIIDKPNERSSHHQIVLRGGGIIFLIGACLYAAFFGLQAPWFLLGLTLIGCISFIDDIHPIPNYYRLIIHFTATILMFFQWDILNWEDWWVILLALIFCTGIINAYNFMDGINGMTGGYNLVVLLTLLIVNKELNFADEHLIVVALLSVLVFCIFNFRKKAKCFAGDIGSVSIAFIILFILGKLVLLTGNLWYIVFLAVYGVDSVLTICHRIMLHENIGQPHRKHAYQLMANELKIPHTTVSAIYMMLQMVISLGAIYLPINKWLYLAIVIIILSVIYITFMKKYYHLHEEYLKTKAK